MFSAFDNDLSLLQACEDHSVQQSIAQTSIEAFEISNFP
ncbi:hypothetical protein TRICHSKD4_5698 [Roseibium sp. TrichSKD4]|nr:hypothetical protein TRICHSKD4_5698 [Roseibium sp. TrichSKD4]